MRRLALVLALAGCTAVPPAPQHRDGSAVIASTTRGAPDSLSGNWVVAATYPGGPYAPGAALSFRLDAGGSGALVSAGGTRDLAAEGLGRFRSGDLRLWLLWADDDFRIAVIGAPDGATAWIMERPEARGREDLRRAAREILQFNGFDPAAMVAG